MLLVSVKKLHLEDGERKWKEKTEEEGVWFCLHRNNAFASELLAASGNWIYLYTMQIFGKPMLRWFASIVQ